MRSLPQPAANNPQQQPPIRDVLILADQPEIAATLARHARCSHRVRLEIPSLLGDRELAARIECSANAQPGVIRAEANPHSARVLIEYAADAPIVDELEHLAHTTRHRTVKRAGLQLAVDWHAEDSDDVCRRLATSCRDGLSARAAHERLDRFGPNVIADEEVKSRLALLASQLQNAPTAMLLGSTLISLLLGDVLEAGAIVTVIALNTTIGYRVERTSESLLESWRATELGTADVIRDGSITTVPAADLVPGDLLVVRAGDMLVADARVVDAERLTVDEASLTGESEPVAKDAKAVARSTMLAERRSMLYRGTTIASGHARAVVVATGPATEIASVQRLTAQSRAPKGRLQARLNALGVRLSWAGLAAAGATALAGLAHRRNPLEVVRDTVALGVAAIPEGLPVTTTAALVRAMARLRSRGIVVRRLATAETLGAITVACTDKTGTLTENRMRLEWISLLDGSRIRRIASSTLVANHMAVGSITALLVACVLNSDIEYQRNHCGTLELDGSATERALVEAARKIGIDPSSVRTYWERVRLIERGDGKHYVVSEHARGVAFIKGAPEQVVPLCAVDDEVARELLAENYALAARGLRVLAVGYQQITRDARCDAGSWQFLGFVAMRDPLRRGSVEALHAAERAGIRTVVLTGDQRATARAIAEEAELRGDIVEGHELDALLTAPDARDRLERLAVVARVTPAQKVTVVEALRESGHVVAMLGDGINDAPALRAADVGVAVGAESTDLARQTADIVLRHPDLRSVLEAIAEGRAVQDNLRRSIGFQAAGNLGEILLAFGAAVLGQRLIGSLGLLWINLLTDTFPGLALALEPTRGRLLERAPLPPTMPILDRSDWRRIARDGALLAASSGAAAIAGGPLAAFAAIGATQFGYATARRSSDHARGVQFGALVGGSAALHLAAVASTPARSLLRISGAPAIGLASFALGFGVPLYLGWRRSADYKIVRVAKESS
ncbi:MAG TPA: HAD-IC family P-type ATPase [Kofleriaceae bacterium]|nr:HAD-IC family P-type ATPase [Kofleriaceae bacterium]